MADNGLWFKLWCSADNDPDLDNLDVADFGRWCKLGAHIKAHGTGGILVIQPPSRTLCAKFQVGSFDLLIDALKRLPKLAIEEGGQPTVTPETNPSVSYKLHFLNWSKYQGDFSTHRVRNFRSRNDSMKRSKRRGEETRREENIITPNGVISRKPPKRSRSGNGSWPDDDLWLKTFLEEQTFLPTPKETLLDQKWWENVGHSLNGLDLNFLRREFAKMAAWLNEHPQRIPRLWKKFIRGWLNRAYDQERRFPDGSAAKRR